LRGIRGHYLRSLNSRLRMRASTPCRHTRAPETT
jgi:hypothetical protein